jgi:hypothetical protein
LAVPATGPAEADAPEGFDDFSALAAGIADEGPAVAAVADGPTCPSCGGGVEVGAVICINCGFNLKTGKKLGTKKVATKEFNPDATAGAGYISRGPKKTLHDEEPPPEKKRMMQILLAAGIVLVLAGVSVAIVLGRQSKKKRDAEIAAAGPGTLERIITVTEGNEGGLVGAMKDGTIMGAVDPRKKPTAPAPNSYKGKVGLTAEDFDWKIRPRWESPAAVEARKWIKEDANRRLTFEENNADSVKWIENMYTMGAKEVRVVDPYQDKGDIVVIHLPAEKDKRKKLLEWEAKEAGDDEVKPDLGQLYIMINMNPKEF